MWHNAGCTAHSPLCALPRHRWLRFTRRCLTFRALHPVSEWVSGFCSFPPSPLVVCSSGGARKAVMLVVSLNATKKLTRSCWFTSSSHHSGIFYFSPINGKVPGRTSGVYTSRQRRSGPARGKDDLKGVYRPTLRFYCADFSSEKYSRVYVGQINT